MTFNAEQCHAIERATSKDRVLLISGGAGTGKTTIAKAICEKLDAQKEQYLLCAFAGKAAARLREATERPASTIHRMLQFQGSNFMADDDFLVGKSVLVDESSMIDIFLLQEIIKRKPRRLILIGDSAQLPPVGRGSPYADLISLRPDLCVNLTRCYRATEAIFRGGNSFRQGDMPPLSIVTTGESWTMINTGDPQKTQKQILEWVFTDGSWDWEADIILAPRNGEDGEPGTVKGLNFAIANRIHPRDEKTKFIVGDRVVNLKNVIELDFWNGSTGTISAIDIDGGIWIKTDLPVLDMNRSTPEKPIYKDRVLFPKSIRSNLSLAYALTAHRAQGSQYKRVCVVCLNRDIHCSLNRSWLYTAATRAKECVAIAGQLSSVKAGLAQIDSKQTCMQQFALQENGHTVIQELSQGEK